MNENETTYWEYKFWWKGAQCEARDGSIFVNGRQVTEYENVNRSHQTEERFFIEGQDVTDVILKYFGSEAFTPAHSEIRSEFSAAETPSENKGAEFDIFARLDESEEKRKTAPKKRRSLLPRLLKKKSTTKR